ncbi:site-specific integrase [Anaerotignum propionicum]|uniref:Prophage phiRv2 integrase n=1 Tax=Anaerotignum propionicum DSM 1682 TaxID=991789 RepID=A0A0X1U6W1_ANAPI|nr:site-specific integrase [Anaerotignum propionicum]AMJ40670.1 putative prophage phiRv2 integrase [Anaerotignum propionicum DSM 1682]SHE90477.1 Site-specific recombinase XerD [[Clostridium] propionicum DSM 1682] [Anaerotignum propionicum DSM 1682]
MPVYKDDKRNSWFCTFYYTDWQGNKKKKKKEGFKLKREAQDFEREFIKQQSGSCDMTFKCMTELYMKDCKNVLKPTSFEVKKSIVDNRIIPELGDMPINQITPNTLRQFNNKLLESNEYSNLYLKKVNGQISCIFNFAVRYYNLSSNPCKIYEGIQGKPKADIQFWTLEEYKKFIASVKEPEYKLAFEILFWTGMRSGELLALTVGDIDLIKKEISISKNYAKLHKEELILTPKTKKSKRIVEIPIALCEAIQEYLSHIYDCGKSTRLITASRPTLRVVLNKYAEAAGVKQIRIHDLRHSHASLLIEMGFQPLVVADRLGHENIKTTLEVYSHLYPNKQTTVCEKLDALMK